LKKNYSNLDTLTEPSKINQLYAARFNSTLTNLDRIFVRVCQGCKNKTHYWQELRQGCPNLDMLKTLPGKDCGKVAGLNSKLMQNIIIFMALI